MNEKSCEIYKKVLKDTPFSNGYKAWEEDMIFLQFHIRPNSSLPHSLQLQSMSYPLVTTDPVYKT